MYLLFVSVLGHLKIVFDFGFERQELIFPNKHFALGQYHDVRLSRKNSGSTMVLQVYLIFLVRSPKRVLGMVYYIEMKVSTFIIPQYIFQQYVGNPLNMV